MGFIVWFWNFIIVSIAIVFLCMRALVGDAMSIFCIIQEFILFEFVEIFCSGMGYNIYDIAACCLVEKNVFFYILLRSI